MIPFIFLLLLRPRTLAQSFPVLNDLVTVSGPAEIVVPFCPEEKAGYLGKDAR